MIIKNEFCKLTFLKNTNQISNQCKLWPSHIEYKCESCGILKDEKYNIFKNRFNIINLVQCGKCSRSLLARYATMKGQYDENGKLKPNAGRFSKERVDNMSPEQYETFRQQRIAANKIHQNKLNNNPEYKEQLYKKIYQNSKIGYVSKPQMELHSFLEKYGFIMEYQISSLKCDLCNPDKKLIIEYYGDIWHANPRKYSPDQYITAIKKTAREKWVIDRKRIFFLRRQGYNVLIIWEHEWLNDKLTSLNKIKTFLGHDVEHNIIINERKKQWIHSDTEKRNKMVDVKDVKWYISQNWSLGRAKYETITN